MNFILQQLNRLADSDLYGLSEAIEMEMQRRAEVVDDITESARRRAIERGQSYRRRTGSTAPQVRFVGIGRDPKRRAA
jgi:hypothetical protein